MMTTPLEIGRQAARKAFDKTDTFDEFDQIADAVTVAVLEHLHAAATARHQETYARLQEAREMGDVETDFDFGVRTEAAEAMIRLADLRRLSEGTT